MLYDILNVILFFLVNLINFMAKYQQNHIRIFDIPEGEILG